MGGIIGSAGGLNKPNVGENPWDTITPFNPDGWGGSKPGSGSRVIDAMKKPSMITRLGGKK